MERHSIAFPFLGLLVRVNPHLKLQPLAIPYSGKPKVRCDILFSFGAFYVNKCQFITHFVLKPHFKLLALVIS